MAYQFLQKKNTKPKKSGFPGGTTAVGYSPRPSEPNATLGGATSAHRRKEAPGGFSGAGGFPKNGRSGSQNGGFTKQLMGIGASNVGI